MARQPFDTRSCGPLIALTLAWLASSGAALGEAGEAGSVAPEPPSAVALIRPAELTAFLDDFVAQRMQASHVPGLVFVMVKDGGVLLAKGYGEADIARHVPMTPHSALRAGSVSKAVTAAGVMQLVERGLVSLDAPVDRYLAKLELTDRFGSASTVAQLLTHTGGYDDTILCVHAPTLEEWRPLAAFLAAELPPRAMAPGRVVAYSSWDYALLGMIIETVTGLPYEQYMAREIFEPLGMTDSTFVQPLPPHVAAELATGYRFADGRQEAVPLDLVKLSPGVALVTTGDDMATYLLALLGGGQHGGARILKPETVQTMLQRHATHHPLLRGYSYGPVEVFYNGERTLQQDGNGIGFSSRLLMMPQHGMGFFIAINAPNFAGPLGAISAQVRMMRELSDALFDRYFPAPDELANPSRPAVPFTSATRRAARYEGYYRTANYSRSTFLKLEALFDQFPVRSNGDGTLRIAGGRYVEIEPLLFQLADGRKSFATFREDGDGNVTHLLFGGSGSYEKTPWYDSLPFQLGLAGGAVLLFLSALVVWPLALLAGRRSTNPAGGRRARALAALTSLLNLIFLAGFGWCTFTTEFLQFFTSVPPLMKALLVIPVLTSVMAAGMAVCAVFAWTNKWWTVGGRLHYTSLALAALIFIVWLHHWNLL